MKALLCAVVLMLGAYVSFAQTPATTAKPKYHDWWNDRVVGEPLNSPNANKLPRISVRGNKFVDPQGRTVLFRGLSISDPDKVEHQGHWNREHFVHVKEMGANLVRIPVHPVAWRERTPKVYLALLDQAVEWCTELGMYVDIDWHTIGNLKSELFQDPMYNTTMGETFEFWRTISRHYSGHNTVAFYELFNEPTLYSNQLGRISWDEWKKINEDMIATIRSYDRQTIPLVAGFDWAYDLSPLRINPVEAAGIGYVTHPYPHKRSKPWEPKWEENFGFAADQFPVIATELGFSSNTPTPEDLEYGQSIITYLEGRGISWLVWVYDPEWTPSLLKSWDYSQTDFGKYFQQALTKPANAQGGATPAK